MRLKKSGVVDLIKVYFIKSKENLHDYYGFGETNRKIHKSRTYTWTVYDTK